MLALTEWDTLEGGFRDGLPKSLKLETVNITIMIGKAANASSSIQIKINSTLKKLELLDHADLLFTPLFNFQTIKQ